MQTRFLSGFCNTDIWYPLYFELSFNLMLIQPGDLTASVTDRD